MQNLFTLFVLVGGCPYQRCYVWGFVSLLSYADGVVDGPTPAALCLERWFDSSG